MKEFEIRENEAGQRLDKYLGKLLSKAPMSFVYKMLRKKNFTLNEKKAGGSELLKTGDKVRLFLSDETFEKFCKEAGRDGERHFSLYTGEDLEKLGLAVVYEDEHILVFNKPSGMLSQRAEKEDISVNEYLIGYLLSQKVLTEEMLTTFKPAAANRLDRNTSGLILCGKSLSGLQYLSEIIKNRTLEKHYRCIVEGRVCLEEISSKNPASKQTGTELVLEGYLTKDKEKNKVTIAKSPSSGGGAKELVKTGITPIRTYGRGNKAYTELSVHLITGKPHQIRAHLAGIGHPVVGDMKYGRKNGLSEKHHIKSQLLHAYRVVFPPSSGKFAYLSGMELSGDPPLQYRKILEELANGNME